MTCFRDRYAANEKFLQFVHRLKMDTLTIDEFLIGFIEFVSGRLGGIQFDFWIVWPLAGCKLVGNIDVSLFV